MATISTPHQWKYDVFVSFRGEDIRKNFMDHLFKDFRQKGIRAFRDDNELPKGEEISPELFKAIEESRFLLVIFSQNYASSSWCLRELVKILECKQVGEHKHEVRIIFYDVKPDVVRKQTGSYAEAFAKHDVLHATEVAKWKESLSMASNLSGWDLMDMANGYESTFIDSISKEIFEKVHLGPLHVGENLVGVYDRVDILNLLSYVGSNKVHLIGICGIGGIGKTTFAKAMFNKLHMCFEVCSFCEDVQGTTKLHGLAHVQMQIIEDITKTRGLTVSNVSQGVSIMNQTVASKRILLVLDDVDHTDQIDALAGSRDWFFPGSVIIFTCKDKQLLSSYKVDEIYHMGYLNDREALELFSLHAFGVKHPTKGFKELADEVMIYVKGHPLALKVLGRFLSDKTTSEWRSELDRLQVYPNADVQKVLRVSFDGLTDDQKRIFLDIAIAFIGEKKDFTTGVLESCKQFPQINIRVLLDKSLITISRYDEVQMHDLIQIMARNILCEEYNMRGKCHSLRIQSKDLKENEVPKEIEVLVLLLENSTQKVHIDGKAFLQLKNLRIVKIYDPKESHPKDFNVNYTGRVEFLSNKLSWLCWHGYPFKSLPSDFHAENIVAIDLSYSRIKNLWRKTKCLKRLKVLKLKCCYNLTNTPDFTEITNLKELHLNDCVNLVKAHPSIGMLKRLVVLSMQDCKRLKNFRCKFEMESLETMNLSGCLKVDKFPEFVSKNNNLKDLYLYETGITELPSFVSSLSNLQYLSYGQHKGTLRSRHQTSMYQSSCFPNKLQHPHRLVFSSFAGLFSLRWLYLSYCNILQVPDSIGDLSCLYYLCLEGNDFTSLPRSLSQLPRLELLSLDDCKKLETLPKQPPKIQHVWANNCTSLQQVVTPFLEYTSWFLMYELCGCQQLLRNINPSESIWQPQDLTDSHGSRERGSSFMNYFLRTSVSEFFFHMSQDHYHFGTVEMVLHGNIGIPEWIKNQNKRNDDMKLEIPRGFASCVVFTTNKSDPTERLRYVIRKAGGDYVHAIVGWSQSYELEKNRDTTWLHYGINDAIWRFDKEMMDPLTISIEYNEEVYEVKTWGVRLLWEKEDNMNLIRMVEDLPTTTIHGRCHVNMLHKNLGVKW